MMAEMVVSSVLRALHSLSKLEVSSIPILDFYVITIYRPFASCMRKPGCQMAMAASGPHKCLSQNLFRAGQRQRNYGSRAAGCDCTWLVSDRKTPWYGL